jgi:phage-related protein
MTFPTFTPPIDPSPGTSARPELKLYKADFGDGYTQTTRAGMNHNRAVLTLEWEALTVAQHKEITDFLTARGGDETFLYALPGETTRKWTCDEWETQHLAAGLKSLTATFRQSFALTN